MAANVVGAKISRKMWDGPWWEGVWPFLDPWDVVGLRTAASVWNAPKKYGPYGELLFFFTGGIQALCHCCDIKGALDLGQFDLGQRVYSS